VESVAMSVGLEFVATLGEELAAGTLHLPTFPDVAMRVREALDDENCTNDRLAKVIGADPVLAAQVMRVANSAAYARGGEPVADLRIATSRLGQDTLRNTAIAFAMHQIASAEAMPAIKAPLGAVWRHSVYVAAIAHCLAKRLTRLNPEEAMLAGLVHDIGKLYILMRAAKDSEVLDDEEMLAECMEQWHPGVGRAIVEAWDFSDAIAVAVDEHEEFDRGDLPVDLTTVVTVANVYAKVVIGELDSVVWNEIPAIGKLGLTADTAEEIVGESAEEIQSLVDALKV